MAEAWTIVGVAVNIATIIDLGFKLVSAGISAHESMDGTTREIQTLNILLDDIQNTNSRLQAMQSLTDGLSSRQPGFRSLARECDQLVKELNHILAKLKIRKEATSRTIESGRVAIQSWWKRKDIAAMKSRLFEVESRLKDAVASLLSQYIFRIPRSTPFLRKQGKSTQCTTEIVSNMRRNQHSSVMAELQSLHAEGQMHERQTQDLKLQMDRIRHDIANLSTKISGTAQDTETAIVVRLKDLLESGSGSEFSHEQLECVLRDIETMASKMGTSGTTNATTTNLLETVLAATIENQPTGDFAGYAAQLYQIRKDILQIVKKDPNSELSSCSNSLLLKLNALTRERNTCVSRLKVLKSLYFPELKRRFTDITNAEANTLDWLYGESETSFPYWLSSQHGIYWINGLAGSGKSTLMKFAAGNVRTKLALKRWAGNFPLHIASHYFWHHGHSIQRSQVGLFRSLLYQILRATPVLIPLVCPNSEILEFEEWEMVDLRTAFDRLCQQTSLSAKFCFFIDGLDEYSGEERDLIETLRVMTSSPHIKICASSRPWPEFAKEFGRNFPTLVVQDHTMDDMKTYVKQRLSDEPEFQKLRLRDNSCDEIIPEIAERAQGVWLWTFLVTHDLKRAVIRNEGTKTLRMILDSFPRRLEDYFEHIISRVEPHYQKDMVRIFMMVVEAAQPLPLFVFRFLSDQDEDPTYAINVTPKSLGPFDAFMAQKSWTQAIKMARAHLDSHDDGAIQDASLQERVTDEEKKFNEFINFVADMEIWKTRIHNRCSDLLRVTEDEDTELLLRFRVSFLHRTVADWLRENYATRMQQILSQTHSIFNTKRTLCYMLLMLLKTFPAPDATPPHRLRRNINEIIAFTDELLCYVYQLEQTDSRLPENDLMDLLDDLDATNSTHFDYTTSTHLEYTSNHWTNVRDWPRGQGNDRYIEGGQCNFMALAVQCRLVRYVRSEMKSTDELKVAMESGKGGDRAIRIIGGQPSPHERHPPQSLYKKGRPLLDYALRPRRVTPLDLPYHLQTENPSVDSEMVQLLVDRGAEVNARVFLNDGRTVFELFVISCYEACRAYDRPKTDLMQAWYRSTCILVENGARLDGASYQIDGGRVMTTEDLLVVIFGRGMTSDLQQLSLASLAKRPDLGFWALRKHELIWDMLHWILLLLWEPSISACTSR